jgi:hypothetical protein
LKTSSYDFFSRQIQKPDGRPNSSIKVFEIIKFFLEAVFLNFNYKNSPNLSCCDKNLFKRYIERQLEIMSQVKYTVSSYVLLISYFSLIFFTHTNQTQSNAHEYTAKSSAKLNFFKIIRASVKGMSKQQNEFEFW